MTRLSSLAMLGVAALAVTGAARADDSTAGPAASDTYVTLQPLAIDGAGALAPNEPLVDVELGLSLGGEASPVTTSDVAAPLSASSTFGRDLLVGLGETDDAFSGGPFVGTLLELADTFSLATAFRTNSGGLIAGDRVTGVSALDEMPDDSWYLGLQASYRPSDHLTIGLNYGLVREVDRVLGTPGSGHLAEADQALTQSLGLGVSYVFNDRLSATVFYDHVRVEAEGSGLTHPGGETWVGQKLGASVAYNRISTETDRLSVAALQPFNVFSAESRGSAGSGEGASFGPSDPISQFLDPEAIPLTLSFSYLDEGAAIPRGLTFSFEDDDVRDRDGLNVSAMATVKVPF